MKQIKFLVLLTFDDINNIEIIKNRIMGISKYGFDGIVLNPDAESTEINLWSDKYMSVINEIILFAKNMDISVWLAGNDTDYSGHDIPSTDVMWLEYSNGKIEKHSQPGKAAPYHEICTYELIANTYERYKSGLSKEAFSYLTGFAGKIKSLMPPCTNSFVPWYDGMESDYMNEYNIDLTPFLNELFEDNSQPVKFRARYREMLVKRFNESFVKPITTWCEQNDKKFFSIFDSGMTPIKQVDTCCSHIQTNRAYNLPSVCIYSHKSKSYFYPYTAGSLARQFGSGEAIASVFTKTGWGLNPGEFEDCLARLIESGITTFVLHNCFLRLDHKNLSSHLISFPENLPWKKAIPEIFDNMRKKADAEEIKPRKILVVCPSRGIWENYVPGCHDNSIAQQLSENVVEICDRLHEMHRRFDVTDEVIFENDTIFSDGHMKLGNSEYSVLLVTPGCSFSKKGMLAIEKAKANGVRILNDIPKSDTGIIPLDVIKESLKEIVPVLIHQDNWTITLPEQNCLPLLPECVNGSSVCTFTAEDTIDSRITLLVTDTCENVSINNILVECENTDERGNYYIITDNIVTGVNTITISGCKYTNAYLLGNFKVDALSGYRGFDSRQVQTKYDFAIKNTGIDAETNLVRCGYPFASKYAAAKKIIYSDETVNKPLIKLDCSNSSMIEVFFDNEFIGFLYNNKNTIPLPPITAGEQHVVEIHCYPSGHNIYGDLNYVFGDTGLAIEKNTSDYCRDSNLKLVNWKIPQYIEIIQQF